jgi:hypothetical protein
MVQWWVLVHFGPYCRTFIIPATSFHSGSNDKNFRHFQRAECPPEIYEITRPLLQYYITSHLDSQKPKSLSYRNVDGSTCISVPCKFVQSTL